MITGNTVVFKPSSSDNMSMLTGLYIYKLLKEAGLPDGVFNFVTGPGSEVGDEMATNDGVAGIVFTGSRATGLGMIAKNFAAGKQKVFVVEMGGKNPAIVSKYADIDDAVTGVASAAFGYDGQKCSALSRVYVHESIKELFVSKLIDKIRTFKIGNPLDKNVYMGPLISESAYKRYLESVEKAKREGRILYGGNAVNTGLNGLYVEPTIVEVPHSSELVHKELFVPILTIESYKSFEEALKMANDVEYGLTAGLYSNNNHEIKMFENGIMAGVVYINRAISATTGAIVGLHTFVGWKGSGLTGKGTGSKYYLEQFMREQSISRTIKR
ncbi:MAG: aldehyde dehydrogenase family protein, partial [Candidatus Micrarchaeia archaeon]